MRVRSLSVKDVEVLEVGEDSLDFVEFLIPLINLFISGILLNVNFSGVV